MAKKLSEISKQDLRDFFDSFDNVLCDCDGVIFIATKILPGVSDTIAALKRMKKNVNFITNNSSVPRHIHLARLQRDGIEVVNDDIINPARAVIDYLKGIKFDKKVYMISLPGMRLEFEAAGIKVANEYKPEIIDVSIEALIENIKDIDPEVGAVVACFDINMTYSNLNKAATYISNPDVLFITTGYDHRVILGTDLFCLGPSYFHEILKTSSGRKPLSLGKPSVDFQKYVNDIMKYDPKRTIFVGDSLEQDMAFAEGLKYKKLLVLSGNSSFQQMKTCAENEKPDYYIDSFGDIAGLISQL